MTFAEAQAIKRKIAPYYVRYMKWLDDAERARATKSAMPAMPDEVLECREGIKAIASAVRRDWAFGDLRVTIIDHCAPQIRKMRPAFIVTLPGGGDFEVQGSHYIAQLRHELYRIDIAHGEFQRWLNGEVDALLAEPNC